MRDRSARAIGDPKGHGLVLVQQLGELMPAAAGLLPRERTLIGKAVVLLPFALIASPAVWSWFRIAQRVWQRRWQQPRWYARLLWTCLYTAVYLWAWASLSRGLTPNSQAASCRYANQPFDSDYYFNHHGPLPPLLVSSPCNRNYDLVPGWTHPAIVLSLLMTIAALVALTACGVRAVTRRTLTGRAVTKHAVTNDADAEPDGAARGN